MNERNLPCSDCGSNLVDNHVPAHELSTLSTATIELLVADCPGCGARYYPEETISKLQHLTADANRQEGS